MHEELANLRDQYNKLYEAFSDALDRIHDLENDKAALQIALEAREADLDRWIELERCG